MKIFYRKLLVVFSFVIFGSLSYAQQYVDVSFTTCRSVSATFVSSNPVCPNCYLSCAFLNTNYLEYPILNNPACRMSTSTSLQRKSGSSWITVETKPGSQNVEFTNLSEGTTYRIQVRYPYKVRDVLVSLLNGQQAIVGLGFYLSMNSTEFEPGAPVPNGYFWDNSGESDNDRFCIGDPVIFYARSSTGETAYNVSMSDSHGNWTTTGWISGEAGLIDLEEVWTQYHSDWWLWPGDYTMQLAVSSPCQGYVEDFFPFEVVEMDCRQGSYGEGMDLSGMLIYPNPVEDILNLNGLENVTKDKEYYITDMSSRTISQGKLEEDRISVSHLDAGMYIFTVITEDDRVSKKFVKK